MSPPHPEATLRQPVDRRVVESDQDAILLDRLRGRIAGERPIDALEELSARYSAKLARAAYLYLGDEHASEDAAQDALLAAWDGAKRTGVQTNLRSWLFGT